MNGLIPVEFDGKVFVPLQPVSLPVGAKCAVDPSPIATSNATLPPAPLTANEMREWDEILASIRRTGVPWRTVEEALGRPEYES